MEKIIFTGGTYLKLWEEPKWNDYHERFYAPGCRWIKSKKHFSSNSLFHNFITYEEITEDQLPK